MANFIANGATNWITATGTTTTVTGQIMGGSLGYYQQAAYYQPQPPAPPPPESALAWLDRRVNEVRVKL